MKNTLLLIVLLGWLSASAQISPYLERIIKEKPGDKIPVILILDQQWKADSAMKAMKVAKLNASERIRTTVKSIKAFTRQNQKGVLADLQNMKNQFEFDYVKPFWAANIIAIKTTPEAIYALAGHKDLMEIVYDEPGYAIYPDEKVESTQIKEGAEQGLIAINAPFLWSLGYTGKGRIAMGVDTGVFPDHPAFENRFLGNYRPLSQCWYGFNNTWPFDISDHGTHTMGTTIGFESRYNDTIGVAFDAYFIAADPIVSNLSEVRPRSELMESFQWALDPDGDENTVSDVPDAINNSWGLSNSGNPDHCEMAVTLVLNTVEAAGIAVIFSAGNDGPGAGTVGEPAHIARSTTNVFSVGAISGGSLVITDFSSRGPTNCYNGPDTSLHIKPEVVAPGQGVYSALPYGNYGNMSGTSMAAPHVTGAVVLLKEPFPEVPGDEILMALYNTATDLGDVGEDNVYGNGLINLEAAYNYLAASHTPVPPITDFVDPYVILNQRQYLGPKSGYDVTLEVFTTDSIDFNIENLNLYYEGDPLAYDTTMIDSAFKKVITITLDPVNFNSENFTHSIKGVIETDALNDDTINNQFWFEVYHPALQQMPYAETFENGNYDFINTSVFSENPDKFITWKVDTIDGFLNNTKAAKMLFVKYNRMERERDIMHFPPVDISLADAPNFSFQYSHAKRAFSIYKDSLMVLARYGTNYEERDTLFLDFGQTLATMDENYNTFNFVPIHSYQWRDTTISLSHLQSYGQVKIEFVAINDNGNNLWVDNVSVHEGEYTLGDFTSFEHEVSVRIYPNPARSHVFIKSNGQKGTVSIFNYGGQLVSEYSMSEGKDVLTVSLDDIPRGVYLVKFSGEKTSTTKKLIKY
jgi:subtilisin family serine protease